MASQVLGVSELVQRLNALPKKVRNRGMRQALSKAAKPVVAATKARAPVRTGLLRQSIASKVIKGRDGNYRALIGEKRLKTTKRRKKAGFKPTKTVTKRMAELGVEGTDPARYAHLVEFGHAKRPRGFFSRVARFFGIGGGRVGARPFAQPGLEAAAGAAQAALQQSLREFIQAEAGKA